MISPPLVEIEEVVPADAILTKDIKDTAIRVLFDEVGALHPWVVAIAPASPDLRKLVPLDDRDLLNDKELGLCYVLGHADERPPSFEAQEPLSWKASDGMFTQVVCKKFRPDKWYSPKGIAAWTKACSDVRKTDVEKRLEALERRK
jgi:hypothetical protein